MRDERTPKDLCGEAIGHLEKLKFPGEHHVKL